MSIATGSARTRAIITVASVVVTVEGKRQRYKVSASTKSEVADKLRAKVDELHANLCPGPKDAA